MKLLHTGKENVDAVVEHIHKCVLCAKRLHRLIVEECDYHQAEFDKTYMPEDEFEQKWGWILSDGKIYD